MEENKRENLIVERSFDFSLQIIKLYKKLLQEHEYVISKQVLKSGTSIGANINEAQAAQSKKDFIAKMSIASKEARETKYWLRLLSRSALTNNCDGLLKTLLHDVEDIINVLTRIVKTSSDSLKKC